MNVVCASEILNRRELRMLEDLKRKPVPYYCLEKLFAWYTGL
jgi:hypothetical protein